MIELKITLGKHYELNLEANNMNELVDKIIEWQLWENQPLELFKKNDTLEENRNSNWYYFNN